MASVMPKAFTSGRPSATSTRWAVARSKGAPVETAQWRCWSRAPLMSGKTHEFQEARNTAGPPVTCWGRISSSSERARSYRGTTPG